MMDGRRMRMVGPGAAALWLVLGLGAVAAHADEMAPAATPAALVPVEAPTTTAVTTLSPAVVKGLGRLYARDYAGAVDRFAAAAEADPQDPAARYYLGYAYYRMGDFGRARTAFAEAYRLDPHFSPESKSP